jgi:hypothetical protein
MNKIKLHLLAFIFAAFLPPKNADKDEDEDYYKILGLEDKKSCTQLEIRKAYRKKSLQYHPDKVAQFARSKSKSTEEIQADFVKIKEAYELLSDDKKRNMYDVFGPEMVKMFDKEQPFDPTIFLLNLSRASFVNKTKLFFLVILAEAIVLLGPILICIKVDSIIKGVESGALYDAKWVLVLIPIWLFNLLYIALLIIGQEIFDILLFTCIVMQQILLALQWDQTIDWKYELVLIPLFVYHLTMLIESYVTIRRTRHDITRMVSVSYLEERILPTFAPGKKYYRDLSEEEQEQINELYIIVGTGKDDFDDDDEESSNSNNSSSSKNHGLDPETKDLFEIAKSSEFQDAVELKKECQRTISRVLFTRLPFCILLVLQLDLDKGWDWNLVFCTIWIEVCLDTLSNCFTCCCSSSNARLRAEFPEEQYAAGEGNVTSNDGGVGGDVEIGQKKADNIDTTDQSPGTNGNTETNIDLNGFRMSDENVFSPVTSEPLIAKDDENDDTSNTDNKSTNVNNSGTEAGGHHHNNNDDDDDDDDNHSKTSHGDDPLRRPQSGAKCCDGIIKIILLSLFLVKLNGSENRTDGYGDFSSFWIIFPMLLFFGLVLCCFGSCIYARIDLDKVDNMMDSFRKKSDDDGDGDVEANRGMVPPVNEEKVDTSWGNDSDDLD